MSFLHRVFQTPAQRQQAADLAESVQVVSIDQTFPEWGKAQAEANGPERWDKHFTVDDGDGFYVAHFSDGQLGILNAQGQVRSDFKFHGIMYSHSPLLISPANEAETAKAIERLRKDAARLEMRSMKRSQQQEREQERVETVDHAVQAGHGGPPAPTLDAMGDLPSSAQAPVKSSKHVDR